MWKSFNKADMIFLHMILTKRCSVNILFVFFYLKIQNTKKILFVKSSILNW